MADPTTGTLNNELTQINVSNIAFRPTETTTLTMTGGINDSGYTSTTPQTIYDSTSQKHSLDIAWGALTSTTDPDDGSTIQTSKVTITNPSSTDGMTVDGSTSTYTVAFDSSGNIKSVKDSSGNLVGTGYSGSSATLPITLDYTNGAAGQTIDLNIGTIGSSAGTTTASANSSTPTIVSDSATSATYEGISMTSDGSVMATFSNGDTQLVGKVALSSFANANGLMAVDGQAYVATSASGSAKTGVAGTNGTGTLKTSSTESSTTDLTSDLSSLIVAQEAYTANTKVITTASTLLETTISMIR